MRKVPFLLIYSRILIGALIALIAFFQINHHPIWIVVLISIGLLTDIFDGIIARKFEISSEKLRIWDSNVDQFFWLISIISIFYLQHDFVFNHIVWIGLILFFEFLCYLFSFLKFNKPIATHSILAKFWTLTLLWFLIDLTLYSTSQTPFILCIVLGIISRLEIILIIIKLKKWTTDVPSLLVVSKINKGIPYKKNKLFNS